MRRASMVSIKHCDQYVGRSKPKAKSLGKKSLFDADTIRDEDTMLQDDTQTTIDIRIEQLQSKMRSKDDMYRVLHDYRKLQVF